MRRGKPLTDAERAEKRAADREYARQAVEALRSSEGWQRWLATRARFHRYSLTNQCLIAMQRPTATRVAGFKRWLSLGYCVQKGETAIRIWAPIPPSKKQLEAWRAAGADPSERPRTFFKLSAVFADLSRVSIVENLALWDGFGEGAPDGGSVRRSSTTAVGWRRVR